jgi:hypothetical protein
MSGATSTLAANLTAKQQIPCVAEESESNEHVSSSACYKEQAYRLQYDRKAQKIVLWSEKKRTVLHRIPGGYDPTLVGADEIIGFLPEALQPYVKENILLYISSIRTTNGDGGGQCGSGSEIYLNFLDVGSRSPKLRSSILIASCENTIELQDQNIPRGKFGEITVRDKKLVLHFLNYKNLEGYPTATVSSDFKRLEF